MRVLRSLFYFPTIRFLLAAYPGRVTNPALCSSVNILTATAQCPARNFHIGQAHRGSGQITEKLTAEEAKKMTNEDWAKRLTPDQFYVTREHGTEAPFSGKYYNHKGEGIYACSNCAADLFSSKTKFDSGCGWPSFYEAMQNAEEQGVAHGVYRRADTSAGMVRTEILCKNCNAHLGHVFDDGPQPTGERYCINSASLKFQPKKLPE